MTEREDLVASYGGRVTNISIESGNYVKEGETIAVVAASKFCPPIEDLTVEDAKEDIAEKRLELQYLKNELALLQKELQRHQEKAEFSRALDLDAPLISVNDTDKLQLDVSKKRLQLVRINDEIEYLKSKKKQIVARPTPVTSPECVDEILLAPFDGKVYSILASQNNIVSKGEPVAQISSANSRTFVYTHVEFEQYQDVSIGKSLSVVLPDGTKTEGIIEDIGAKYEALLPIGLGSTKNARIAVKIKPSSDIVQDEWARFDDYQVKVLGEK